MIGGLIKSIALRLLFQSPSLCIYSLSMLIKCLSFAHCTGLKQCFSKLYCSWYRSVCKPSTFKPSKNIIKQKDMTPVPQICTEKSLNQSTDRLFDMCNIGNPNIHDFRVANIAHIIWHNDSDANIRVANIDKYHMQPYWLILIWQPIA